MAATLPFEHQVALDMREAARAITPYDNQIRQAKDESGETRWFLLSIKTGNALVLHKLFTKAGFEVYTPFERKKQYPRSRKARKEGKPPVVYAEALFSAYLIVGSKAPMDLSLTAIGFIKSHRPDVYAVLTRGGAAVTLTDKDLHDWREYFTQAPAFGKDFVLRGFDPAMDRGKARNRVYGKEVVVLPEFTIGDVAAFMDVGMQAISAEVTSVQGDKVDLLMTLFGHKRHVTASAWDLKKVN